MQTRTVASPSPSPSLDSDASSLDSDALIEASRALREQSRQLRELNRARRAGLLETRLRAQAAMNRSQEIYDELVRRIVVDVRSA